jgi:DNA-binding PucR family transcriptional regulator
MLEDLQQVADGLAVRLHREVAIDDLGFRLLAYTSHVGVIDPVRTEVVLTRQGPSEAVAWARKFHISRARAPVRIPANDELGFLPRVCIPLRHEDILFGWLWLIDPDESLTDAELELARAAADEAGLVIFRETIGKEFVNARERELFRDVLSTDSDVRALAADALIEENRFTSNPGVVALVIRPAGRQTTPLVEDVRHRLGLSADRIAAILPPRESLRLVRPDHAVLLLREAQLERQPGLLREIHALAADATGIRPDDLVIGVGRPALRLADAIDTYRDAIRATRVADVVPGFRPLARFADLGVYRMLVGLPLEELGHDLVHPGIARLEALDPQLVSTLELFLDEAGDTRAVADLLGVHRATVYHRMRRIEEVTGLSLARGDDRLALHLSLKVARLAGAERATGPETA